MLGQYLAEILFENLKIWECKKIKNTKKISFKVVQMKWKYLISANNEPSDFIINLDKITYILRQVYIKLMETVA